MRTSVIIPVRNGVRFIREGIESVLRQLAPDDEIVVVDDASTDATLSVLDSMQDQRVRVLAGSGRGVSSARNIGLAAASGTFIAFLDHDDLWPSQRHRVMIRTLMEDTQLDAVFGRIRIRLEPGGIWWSWMLHQDGRHAPGSNLENALIAVEYFARLTGSTKPCTSERISIISAVCKKSGFAFRSVTLMP